MRLVVELNLAGKPDPLMLDQFLAFAAALEGRPAEAMPESQGGAVESEAPYPYDSGQPEQNAEQAHEGGNGAAPPVKRRGGRPRKNPLPPGQDVAPTAPVVVPPVAPVAQTTPSVALAAPVIASVTPPQTVMMVPPSAVVPPVLSPVAVPPGMPAPAAAPHIPAAPTLPLQPAMPTPSAVTPPLPNGDMSLEEFKQGLIQANQVRPAFAFNFMKPLGYITAEKVPPAERRTLLQRMQDAMLTG